MSQITIRNFFDINSKHNFRQRVGETNIPADYQHKNVNQCNLETHIQTKRSFLLLLY